MGGGGLIGGPKSQFTFFSLPFYAKLIKTKDIGGLYTNVWLTYSYILLLSTNTVLFKILYQNTKSDKYAVIRLVSFK